MRRLQVISEFNELRNLPKLQYPLLSVVDVSTVAPPSAEEPSSIVLNFYAISTKRMRNVHVKYGQHSFDFTEGIEIARELGFEHLPSFSKLFKTKPILSPQQGARKRVLI